MAGYRPSRHVQEMVPQATAELAALGYPNMGPVLLEACRRAMVIRRRLNSAQGMRDRRFVVGTYNMMQRLASYLMQHGIPPAIGPRLPSKGVHHSIYVAPGSNALVFHINGRNYNALS